MLQQPTKIEFYKSAFCPRCMVVDRALARLEEEFPDLELIKIDVVTHPLAAWRNNIRMIPALKAGSRTIAGVFLSGKEIRRFVGETMHPPD